MEKKFDLSNRIFIPILIIAIEIIIGLGVLVYLGVNNARGNTVPQEITVSAEGKALVKPDVAIATLGLTTDATTSQDAVAKNNDKMNTIIKEIKALGIEDKDIQTTNYNLYPKYDYSYGKNDIDGYSLTQEVTLKIRDFTKVSPVLQKATSLGANTINQLRFTVDNPDTVKNEAISQAIINAKAKAQTMADSSGLRLGKLINVYEAGTVTPPSVYAADRASMGMGGGEVPAPDIQTGQQEITVTMSLVYRIN